MIQKFTIAKDDTWYLAFPDVTKTHSDKLLCTFTRCTHHRDRSVTQMMLTESTDRGRTWSEPRGLTNTFDHDPDGWRWNCPRLSTLSDGRVVAVVDKQRGSDAADQSPEHLTNWLMISEDQGATWTDLIATPVYGIVPDQLVELRAGPNAGRWLLTAHTRLTEDPAMRSAQRVWWTDDQGTTWHGPSIAAQSKECWFCEGSIVELPNGTLVCFLRENSSQGHDGFKVLSTDGGETWSEPVAMPLVACHRPVGGLLQNGHVLVTHRIRQGGGFSNGQQNFVASLTDVQSCLAASREQANVRLCPIDYDRSPASDTGYSGWVQFDDGEIYIVNYIVDDHHPLAHIRGYTLNLDDLVLPVE